MKNVECFRAKVSLEDFGQSNDRLNVEESPVLVPKEELHQFVESLLKANIRDQSQGNLETSATLVATRIIRIRTVIKGILAELGLPVSPVLDILLDLFVSEKNGRNVSISDAAIAGHCSATTGLRWVGVLIDFGLVQRSDDASDNRRSFVNLTDFGRQVTLQCIEACSVN